MLAPFCVFWNLFYGYSYAVSVFLIACFDADNFLWRWVFAFLFFLQNALRLILLFNKVISIFDISLRSSLKTGTVNNRKWCVCLVILHCRNPSDFFLSYHDNGHNRKKADRIGKSIPPPQSNLIFSLFKGGKVHITWAHSVFLALLCH